MKKKLILFIVILLIVILATPTVIDIFFMTKSIFDDLKIKKEEKEICLELNKYTKNGNIVIYDNNSIYNKERVIDISMLDNVNYKGKNLLCTFDTPILFTNDGFYYGLYSNFCINSYNYFVCYHDYSLATNQLVFEIDDINHFIPRAIRSDGSSILINIGIDKYAKYDLISTSIEEIHSSTTDVFKNSYLIWSNIGNNAFDISLKLDEKEVLLNLYDYQFDVSNTLAKYNFSVDNIYQLVDNAICVVYSYKLDSNSKIFVFFLYKYDSDDLSYVTYIKSSNLLPNELFQPHNN